MTRHSSSTMRSLVSRRPGWAPKPRSPSPQRPTWRLSSRTSVSPEKALPLLEETLRIRTATAGPDHPDTLVTLSNLAAAYWSVKHSAAPCPCSECPEAYCREARPPACADATDRGKSGSTPGCRPARRGDSVAGRSLPHSTSSATSAGSVLHSSTPIRRPAERPMPRSWPENLSATPATPCPQQPSTRGYSRPALPRAA